MEKILTEEQLAKKVEHCAKCLEIKFGGKDGRKHMVICGDTACVSSKSDEIYKRICEIIKERKPSSVRFTGVKGPLGRSPLHTIGVRRQPREWG